jgi:hypothetical protein
MTTFVFLGPSLPRAEAAALLDAVYLPPVAMGDLYTLVESKARPGDTVAIIDGLFEQVPAVWHKEILYALAMGVHVYGASSMGALRASELLAFGMKGVGRIFEAYRDGELDNDDEVAVAHADADSGFRSLSQALVSIRFGVSDMIDAGRMPAGLGRDLVADVARHPYALRSWALAIEAAIARGAGREIIDAIREEAARPDAKARDAAALLAALAARGPEEVEPHCPNFDFQHTSFWSALTQSMVMRVEAARLGTTEGGEEQRKLAAFVRAGGEDRDRLIDGALLDRLALEWTRNVPIDAKALHGVAARIARRNGLSNAEAIRRWREREEIGDAEWRQLLQIEARRQWIQSRFANQIDTLLIARLKGEGLYSRVSRHRRSGAAKVARSAIAKPSFADFGLGPDILQAWYTHRFGPMAPDPAAHAHSLGFESLRDFVDALLECYFADDEVGADSERMGLQQQ